ncbi:MAG TPA: twitching motility protein PilT [Lachnospiraceae bacterium]|nr:twitching motility protein PilT [Lachnospiraceae bacterium]
MVKFYAGEKGEGKTKTLIELANKAIKECGGDVVYIDDDKRPMYELHHDIRFVEVNEFPLVNYRELIGFIYGIFSQNNDIKQVYIDGVFKLVKELGAEDLIKLISRFDAISENMGVDFVVAGNADPNELPKEIEKYIVK